MKKKEIDSRSLQNGQAKPRDMSTVGDAKFTPSTIEVVDGPDFKEHAAALAFMEEKVEVIVHPSPIPDDAPIVETWNDGRRQIFIRGMKQWVRRKFVECLARAKPINYTQQIVKNEQTGDVVQRMIPAQGARYPFSVVTEPNPSGHAWLAKVMAEA